MTAHASCLHGYARAVAESLVDPDKKQLRFNEIVDAATIFYAPDIPGGIRELVRSCDKADAALYVAKAPMWRVLRDQYSWMLT